jgi:hypothetical protein
MPAQYGGACCDDQCSRRGAAVGEGGRVGGGWVSRRCGARGTGCTRQFQQLTQPSFRRVRVGVVSGVGHHGQRPLCRHARMGMSVRMRPRGAHVCLTAAGCRTKGTFGKRLRGLAAGARLLIAHTCPPPCTLPLPPPIMLPLPPSPARVCGCEARGGLRGQGAREGRQVRWVLRLSCANATCPPVDICPPVDSPWAPRAVTVHIGVC